MVAEPWILKMGNQVSTNVKHAFLLHPSKKKNSRNIDNINGEKKKQTIGILSFEVANVMSKTIHLHRSLSDSEISKLKNEILKSEGVQNLVSSDDSYLLELALAEKLDELNRIANVVSRLGKKCTEPALRGFQHVYADIVGGVIHVQELSFLVKDMDGMVKKMERYVSATSNLYSEMEVLNEMEQAKKKFQHNQHEECRRAFEQKLIWQKQDVKHLGEISLWNQTYDKAVELLARTVCTVYARISVVFGDLVLKSGSVGLSCDGSLISKDESSQISGQVGLRWHSQYSFEHMKKVPSLKKSNGFLSGTVDRSLMLKGGNNFKPEIDSRKAELGLFRPEDFNFPCGASPGRIFMECFSLSSSISKFDDDDTDGGDYEEQRSQILGYSSVSNGVFRREHQNHCSTGLIRAQSSIPLTGVQKQAKSAGTNCARFGPKSRIMYYAPPSTVGGSALALHYANVIIVIEKLLRYPHLVGEEARDDLYQMLPTNLKTSLQICLKSYVKSFAIYDAPLAHEWKQSLDGILKWLAPLAHNMIRWQSECNFEQQQIVTRPNVLLLQTLYFADQEKTEAAICKLLVGLNYICRYEHQQNALLDCASSFDFEDCMEWQMQCRTAFVD